MILSGMFSALTVECRLKYAFSPVLSRWRAHSLSLSDSQRPIMPRTFRGGGGGGGGGRGTGGGGGGEGASDFSVTSVSAGFQKRA